MRITIGGFLILSALGGAGYVAVTKMDVMNLDRFDGDFKGKFEDVRNRLVSSIQFWKTGEIATPPDTTPLMPPIQTSTASATTEVAASTLTETAPTEPVIAEKPPAAKVVAPKKTTKKVKKKRPRKRTAKKKTKKKKTVKFVKARNPKKVASNQVQKLVGSYVALKLTSGREVKGILEGKDAKEYKLQLPGLGVFSYPVAKVKGVSLAE